MNPSFSYLLTALAALAAVLALIWAAQRVARLAGLTSARPASGRRLAVEEAVALDPRRRIHLIRCDERQVLVLTGGAQDVVLGWLPVQGEGR
ncbi:MAG: flagellar biosynthetic protein FliO [Acetobacteraceae bacterium]|nr:flagellar biosynthetic protein FliO [Acetobacteraceae bacterium]MBV8575638.1 flagellar biosynthetic protein FliO [Acetobacteraceae bacterium]